MSRVQKIYDYIHFKIRAQPAPNHGKQKTAIMTVFCSNAESG